MKSEDEQMVANVCPGKEEVNIIKWGGECAIYSPVT